MTKSMLKKKTLNCRLAYNITDQSKVGNITVHMALKKQLRAFPPTPQAVRENAWARPGLLKPPSELIFSGTFPQ